MKKIGVWIDKQQAIIVTLENDQEKLRKINSDVETFRIHGGSGTRFKGGPQDVVQDSRYLEREKHQLREYFEIVVQEIKDANEILIFGPAEVPIKFSKEIDLNFKSIGRKVKATQKADSMTDNQVKAYVREYFA